MLPGQARKCTSTSTRFHKPFFAFARPITAAMPEPVENLGGVVKHNDTVEIRWDFKANLSELPPKGISLDAPGPVPLPGSWKCQLKYENDGTDKIRVRAVHGPLPAGAFGRSVVVNIRFALVLGIDERLLHQWSLDDGAITFSEAADFLHLLQLAASGCWPTSEQNSVQQYRCTIIFERDLQLDTARSHHTPIADATKPLRLAGTSATQSPAVARPDAHPILRAHRFLSYEACKGLPSVSRPDDAYLELWTSSGLLATASDYYETLLASGCAETIRSGSKRQRSEAPPPIKHMPPGRGGPVRPVVNWQDSDDETDEFLVERNWPGCKIVDRDLVDLEYQQIDVRETAYSTINAVLLYLATGHIEFAPLGSLLDSRSEGAPRTRRELLDDHVLKHSTLPPPVSPKSVYRLAHLLQEEELQQLALDAVSSNLTIKGAAHELFSPVSIAYADIKKLVLDYVVQNWEDVRASESWKEMRAKATAGEIEGAAQILFDLLSTLHEKDLIRSTPKK